jgi:hypothetical protein
MRLWTVQPAAVWQQLEADGQVWVDPGRVNGEAWIHPRYSWLVWQLRDRITDSRGYLPWWAYCTRPDLRWVQHSRRLGSQEVLLEFDAPDGSFVAFPCWAWQEVYGGNFLALSGAEHRAWEERLKQAGVTEDDWPLPEPFQTELEASWRRLFSPDLPARSWRRGETDRDREAVVEVIRIEQVRKVTAFVGTGKWFRLPPGKTVSQLDL